jgi:D-tyrosyl-tRNA(Tyr) deacylase
VRALVQRVAWARVAVGDELVGEIGAGLCVLVGVTHDDDVGHADRLAHKLVGLRVMPDDQGLMNRSVIESGGSVLVVSQFTLYGDTRKGRRPSYVAAARPAVAEPLVERVAAAIADAGVPVRTGRFGADMLVEIGNDRPWSGGPEAHRLDDLGDGAVGGRDAERRAGVGEATVRRAHREVDAPGGVVGAGAPGQVGEQRHLGGVEVQRPARARVDDGRHALERVDQPGRRGRRIGHGHDGAGAAGHSGDQLVLGAEPGQRAGHDHGMGVQIPWRTR